MSTFKAILLFVLLSTIPLKVSGGIKLIENETLTLQRALALAVKHHPELQAARLRILQMKGLRRFESTPQSPQLAYTRENLPNRGVEISEPEERLWGISQQLEFPLTYLFRGKRFDADIRALEYDCQALEKEIVARVKTAYVRVMYTRELLALAEQSIALAQTLSEAVELRLQAGEASGMEEIRASLALNESENDQREADLAHHLSRYSFFDAMGLDPESQKYSLELPGTLQYFTVDVAQRAILDRMTFLPEFSAARERVRSGKWGLREQKSQLLPSLGAEWFWQDKGEGFRQHGFSITLGIPLWAPLREYGAIRWARAKRDEGEFLLQSKHLDIKKRVEEAWHSYEVSHDIIKKYNDQIGGKAQTLLEMAQEAYRLGEIGMIEMLDNQRAFLESKKRYLTALQEYYLRVVQMERYWHQALVFPESHHSLSVSNHQGE